MFKRLVIGDVHAVINELQECQALIDYICKIADENKVEDILFLGDLFHNMSSVRIEVMSFWKKAFRQLNPWRVTCLVGNHDLDDYHRDSVLMAFPEINVIDKPKVQNNILHVPYIYDNDEFVAICNQNPTRLMYCHALFEGGQYDNGIYTGDEGVDPSLLPQKLIISGHVHKPQAWDKVWFIGAPRWRSVVDANQDRAIWVFEHDETGKLISQKPYYTDVVCRRIMKFIDKEGSPPVIFQPDSMIDMRVDVIGTAEYVNRRAKELGEIGAKVSTFRTDAVRVEVKESLGITESWKIFSESFKPSLGTKIEEVRGLAAQHYGLN